MKSNSLRSISNVVLLPSRTQLTELNRASVVLQSSYSRTSSALQWYDVWNRIKSYASTRIYYVYFYLMLFSIKSYVKSLKSFDTRGILSTPASDVHVLNVQLKTTGTGIKIARQTSHNQQKNYNSVKHFTETTTFIHEDEYWDWSVSKNLESCKHINFKNPCRFLF